MRITIIGCGWLGQALARHWRGHHDLLLTTTRAERLPELEELGSQALLLCGHDPPAMARALAEAEAEAVVLTLAPRGDRQVDAEGYAATYLSTGRCLLDQLPALPQLRQIVYTSSCGVYGDATGGWIDEATAPEPRDAHAAVLLQAEQLLLGAASSAATRGLAVAVLRLGALHGPGRELGPRLARLAGSRLPGDGGTWSNWIHQDDAVEAIDRVVDRGYDGLLNVVDGQPATLRQLVDGACAARGLEPVTWGCGEPEGPGLPNRRIRNTRLLALGVTPARAGVLHQLGAG